MSWLLGGVSILGLGAAIVLAIRLAGALRELSDAREELAETLADRDRLRDKVDGLAAAIERSEGERAEAQARCDQLVGRQADELRRHRDRLAETDPGALVDELNRMLGGQESGP